MPVRRILQSNLPISHSSKNNIISSQKPQKQTNKKHQLRKSLGLTMQPYETIWWEILDCPCRCNGSFHQSERERKRERNWYLVPLTSCWYAAPPLQACRSSCQPISNPDINITGRCVGIPLPERKWNPTSSSVSGPSPLQRDTLVIFSVSLKKNLTFLLLFSFMDFLSSSFQLLGFLVLACFKKWNSWRHFLQAHGVWYLSLDFHWILFAFDSFSAHFCPAVP